MSCQDPISPRERWGFLSSKGCLRCLLYYGRKRNRDWRYGRRRHDGEGPVPGSLLQEGHEGRDLHQKVRFRSLQYPIRGSALKQKKRSAPIPQSIRIVNPTDRKSEWSRKQPGIKTFALEIPKGCSVTHSARAGVCETVKWLTTPSSTPAFSSNFRSQHFSNIFLDFSIFILNTMIV